MWFRNFTGPVWAIFSGNLLLLICILFYLAWWAVSFRPHSPGGPVGMICITAAFLTGVAAIVTISGGILALSPDSNGLKVKFIIAGAGVLFLIMLLITSVFFHRIPTSELMIVHIWAAVEFSMIAVMYGTGHLGAARTAMLAVLTATAFVVTIVCYILFYRLGETERYWDGMIPLLSALLVMAVFQWAAAAA